MSIPQVISRWAALAAVLAFVVGVGLASFGHQALASSGELSPESASSSDPAELVLDSRDFESLIDTIASDFRYWLTVAGGTAPTCDGDCIRDDSRASVIDGLIQSCNRLEPRNLKSFPAASDQAGITVDSLTESCGTLIAASRQLGPPVDSGAWDDAIQVSIQLLDDARTASDS